MGFIGGSVWVYRVLGFSVEGSEGPWVVLSGGGGFLRDRIEKL